MRNLPDLVGESVRLIASGGIIDIVGTLVVTASGYSVDKNGETMNLYPFGVEEVKEITSGSPAVITLKSLAEQINA